MRSARNTTTNIATNMTTSTPGAQVGENGMVVLDVYRKVVQMRNVK